NRLETVVKVTAFDRDRRSRFVKAHEEAEEVANLAYKAKIAEVVQRAPPVMGEVEKVVGKDYGPYGRIRVSYVHALLFTGQLSQAATQFEGMLDAVQRLQGTESELSASALVAAAELNERQRNSAAAEKALLSAVTIS